MFKESLDKLKEKINSFQINTVIKLDADKLKIVNGNLYVYLANDSIRVYDCKAFIQKILVLMSFIDTFVK